MSSISDLRGAVRRAQELVAAARMIGDSAALKDAEFELKDAKVNLAVALLVAAKERKHGVSSKDESVGKSKVVPEGKPR